jgi:P4 family phage/plasmid primase-like protien
MEASSAAENQARSILSKYKISEKDKKQYLNSPTYLNSLITNVVKHIKNFQEIVKDESCFDTEEYLINANNGVVDIRNKTLLPHSPDKLIRNIVNANYISRKLVSKIMIMKLPSTFIRFIKESLYDKSLNDTENQKIVQSFIGIIASLLIGNNTHKYVYILVGLPNTGKSTLLTLLREIFHEYIVTFNNSVLMVSPRTGSDIRPEIINLRGKRIFIGSETKKEAKFDTELIKRLAGNDEVSYRKPHEGRMINFTLRGKFLLATNFCPDFTNLDDQAFLNRLIIADFNNIPENMDGELGDKLLQERDTIFSYLVDEAQKIASTNCVFIADRFRANKQRIYVNQKRSVSQFWKEHIVPYEKQNLPTNMMMKHWVKVIYSVMDPDFCKREKIECLPFEAFAKEFRAISDQFPLVVHYKGHNNNFYKGFDVVGGKSDEYYDIFRRDYLWEMIKYQS